MNPTNANTVVQEATTQTTSATATVAHASSPTPKRIDSFIREQLRAAQSENFSGVRSTADRAAQLGFRSSANLRYAEFLEAFQATPHLSAEYADAYPNSCFLPWPAFHAVRKAMDLWCDLPENYVGAVPDEQLPWMEIFERDPGHEPNAIDFLSAIGVDPDSVQGVSFLKILDVIRAPWGRGRIFDLGHLVFQSFKDFQKSFFVVAPSEAFQTESDWIKRTRDLLDLNRKETIPPDDPLVGKFVRGGFLVVAAWGDEASILNREVINLRL